MAYDEGAPVLRTTVLFYEGQVRRIDASGVLVDLDGGGAVGPVPTTLDVSPGDWVLVAIGTRRTWILEVQL